MCRILFLEHGLLFLLLFIVMFLSSSEGNLSFCYFFFVCTGSGPYVVIDNRSNEASNAQEPSSNEDGNMPL